ncbi:MAG TPA: YkgJ family cysteine cluster protein [Polyangia bacterium]
MICYGLLQLMIVSDQPQGRRVAPGELLRFRCDPALPCFGRCCAGKRLGLYPYDLLRLRRALGRPSAEVLARHVLLEIDPARGWPLFRLALREDGRCPFVAGDGGCGIYADRPTCCRIYPLARAVDSQGREIYLVEDAPSCAGWGGPRELSVDQWVADQELAGYQAANNRMLRLLFHPSRRPAALAEQEIHAIVMGLYNLDVFRAAAAAPGFAVRHGLDPARVAAAVTSDEALLELGHDWVEAVLFGRG